MGGAVFLVVVLFIFLTGGQRWALRFGRKGRAGAGGLFSLEKKCIMESQKCAIMPTVKKTKAPDGFKVTQSSLFK